MQRAVVELQRDHAAADALVVHDQVDGEEFDVEFRGVTQCLAVHRMQHGMAGTVGGGAGALCLALAPECVHDAEDAQARVLSQQGTKRRRLIRRTAVLQRASSRKTGSKASVVRGERGRGDQERERLPDAEQETTPSATRRRDRHRGRSPVRPARVRRAVAAGGRRRGPGTVGSRRSSRRRMQAPLTAATVVEVLNGRTASPCTRAAHPQAQRAADDRTAMPATDPRAHPRQAERRAQVLLQRRSTRRRRPANGRGGSDHRPVRREHEIARARPKVGRLNSINSGPDLRGRLSSTRKVELPPLRVTLVTVRQALDERCCEVEPTHARAAAAAVATSSWVCRQRPEEEVRAAGERYEHQEKVHCRPERPPPRRSRTRPPNVTGARACASVRRNVRTPSSASPEERHHDVEPGSIKRRILRGEGERGEDDVPAMPSWRDGSKLPARRARPRSRPRSR